MSEGDEGAASAERPGRQPIFMLPGVVTGLIGVMIAIQLAASFVLDEEANLQFTLWFAFVPYLLIEPELVPAGQWALSWTPFTHAFLHAGFEHLLMNVLWLAIFATPVARRYGTARTLLIFFVTSAIGAICFAATTLPDIQFLVGASGGVAGFTGVAVRIMFQPVIVGQDPQTGERIVLGRHLASLKEVFTTPASRNFTLFWVLLNAAIPLLPLLTGAEVAIAWQAHLGGFAAGLLMAPLLERRRHW